MPEFELEEEFPIQADVGDMTVKGTVKKNANLKVAVFEAGHPLDKRHCPIDGEKVTDPAQQLTKEDFANGSLTLKTGKKNFRKIVVK